MELDELERKLGVAGSYVVEIGVLGGGSVKPEDVLTDESSIETAFDAIYSGGASVVSVTSSTWELFSVGTASPSFSPTMKPTSASYQSPSTTDSTSLDAAIAGVSVVGGLLLFFQCFLYMRGEKNRKEEVSEKKSEEEKEKGKDFEKLELHKIEEEDEIELELGVIEEEKEEVVESDEEQEKKEDQVSEENESKKDEKIPEEVEEVPKAEEKEDQKDSEEKKKKKKKKKSKKPKKTESGTKKSKSGGTKKKKKRKKKKQQQTSG